MADKYYGPEKYKGDLWLMKKLNPKLYKKYRKKYKGRYIGPDKYKGVKPKKNPAKSKYVVKTHAPFKFNVVDMSNYDDQSNELIEAYLAIAGSELFQFANTQTIDGAYNDVEIINVLSSRRQAYSPNRIIEQNLSVINAIWIEDGNLKIDIIDGHGFDEASLIINLLNAASIIAETID